MKKTKKDILINVELDENKIPENIKWSAEGGGVTNQDVKALILSTWDFDKKETLKIDLWTKDMPLDHMNIFIYQTLVSLSKTHLRSTNNEKILLAKNFHANHLVRLKTYEEELKNNKIAVCYLNGEFTVKRVKIRKDHIYLVPESDKYEPIKVTNENEFIVWGIVTYVIKKI